MSDLTSRVDNLMINKNVTRYRFCEETGLSESTYRSWIKGSKPSAEAILKVAKYFNVSAEYLLSGENPPAASTELILSDDENELIDIFRSLDKRGQNELLKIAQALESVRG